MKMKTLTKSKQQKCAYDRLIDAIAPFIFFGVIIGLPVKLWMSNPAGFWDNPFERPHPAQCGFGKSC